MKRTVTLPELFAKLRPTFTAEEERLARVEQSWADFAARARTGKGGRRVRTLLRVHALLELHRETLDGGDKSALLWALRECCEENVPLPYWAAAGILDILALVQRAPVSLPNAFGLNKRKLRPSGKRAQADRNDLRDQGLLYIAARPLVAGGLSRDAALKQVLSGPEHHFPFKLRKAVELYERQDRFQQRYHKTTR